MQGRRLGLAVAAVALLAAALGGWQWRAQRARARAASGSATAAAGGGGGRGGDGAGSRGSERVRPLRLSPATVVAADAGSGGTLTLAGRVLSTVEGKPIGAAQLTFLHGGAALSAA